jgi:23S rRNA (uracil1939-C5)-methyltransferase
MKIERLDHQGRGIGYLDNQIVFVDNALPTEEVEIELTKTKRKFSEAKVTKYINKSQSRVEALCPFYDKCGGCDLMHISYQDQLNFKLDKVKHILKKYNNLDLDITISGLEQYNYRNKITLKVKENIGYYHKNSYDLVPINKCLIVDNDINDIINKLSTMKLENIYEIIIKKFDKIMLILKTSDEIDEQLFINSFKDINIVKYLNEKQYLLNGEETLTAKIDEYSFVISPTSFFQVNTDMASVMYKHLLEISDIKKEDLVLDLYCGTGTIGIYLSKYAKKIIGVEVNEDAINDAKKNSELNNITNMEFILGDVKDAFEQVDDKVDVVVLDPPRSGLLQEVIDYINTNEVEKVLYVSCDPMTLSRDIKLLPDYEIVSIKSFDMFPNTHHVETVVKLIKKTI